MANPIKETPVLYGENARRVLERMKHPEPWSKEKVDEVMKAYKHFKKMQQAHEDSKVR
jgi:hypothetical protein